MDEDVVNAIWLEEAVSVSQMADRLKMSRRAARRRLRRLVGAGQLCCQSRGGILGARVLYWRVGRGSEQLGGYEKEKEAR